MAVKIALCNVKGGVGKTALTNALAASLTRRGYKVLLIDGDPQGNLTESCGLVACNRRDDPEGVNYELKDVLDGTVDIRTAAVPTEAGDLIPNTFNLFLADRLYTDINANYRMKKAVAAVEANYDFVIIDSPPNVGILLFMVLGTVQSVIIPILQAKSSVRGISILKEQIDSVRENPLNPDLKILGMVVNRWNRNTKFGAKILAEIQEYVRPYVNAPVFETKIRQGVAIDEASYYGKSIFSHKEGMSNVARDLEMWTDEVLAAVNMPLQKQKKGGKA